MKKWQEIIWIAFLVLLPLFFLYRLFWPTPQLIVTPDFIKSDAFHIGIAGKYLLKQAINNNSLPLWTKFIDSGFPILGEAQTGLFFLPNIVLYKIFDFTTAYNLNHLLAFILIGTGMYFWLKSMKFRSVTSFFGAVTITFSGIVIPRLTQQAVLQGLSFLPWVMWATLKLYKNKNIKWAAIYALIVSQQLLTGFTQTCVVTLIFSGLYFLWLMWIEKRTWTNFFYLVIAVMLTVGLSAVSILPAQEYIKLTSAANGLSLQDATRYSFSLSHLKTFLNPFILGNPQKGTYPELYKIDENIFWENSGYIGLIPLVFILVLFIFFRKNEKKQRKFIFFILLSLLISFLLMWGKYSPLYITYSLWPLNQFRVPARFIWIFDTCLILLACQGFELVWTYFREKLFFKILLIILIFVNTADLFGKWSNYHLLGSPNTWLKKPAIAELFNNQNKYTSLFFENEYNKYFNQGWQDNKPFEFLQNTLSPNSNLIWEIPSNDITGGRFLRRSTYVDDLLMDSISTSDTGATMSAVSNKLLKLQSISNIISTVPLKSNEIIFESSLTDNDINIYLYSVNGNLPRVYLVTDFEVATTLEEARSKIIKADFIPGKNVLLEKSIEIKSDKQTENLGKAEIIEDEDMKIRIKVNNEHESILVLTDTYYPGWKAWVDNVPTTIYAANIRQRAVKVPVGNHEVIFQYKPDSFKTGLKISLFSLIIAIIILISPIKIINKYKNNLFKK